jgi:hypothetical protein
MSFKDLTARAAAALKPKPVETDAKPTKAEVTMAAVKKPAAKSKTT